MKHLIQHLIQNNMDEIIKDSYLNCHVHGLHSLMLINNPKCRVRMYVAEAGCPLKDCSPDKIKFGGDLPLGFHAHHCDLTFEIVKGTLTNWVIFPSEFAGQIKGFKGYKFRSPILEEAGGFELIYKSLHVTTDRVERLYKGQTSFMKASEFHTVSIDNNEVVAWLVYEGQENELFDNLTISNVDLLNGSFEGLYIKPDKSDIERILKMSGLLEYTDALRPIS